LSTDLGLAFALIPSLDAVGAALGGIGTVAAAAAGTLAFFAAALLLRPVAADDAQWLAPALGSTGARGTMARFVRRIGAT
jgi:hypothetical protein